LFLIPLQPMLHRQHYAFALSGYHGHVWHIDGMQHDVSAVGLVIRIIRAEPSQCNTWRRSTIQC